MDLFYRLSVFPVRVPPLRERVDDIPVLVDYFVSRFARRMGKSIRAVEKRTLDALLDYSWPGNIRELQNVIERGVILTDGETFRLDQGTLPRTKNAAQTSKRTVPGPSAGSAGPENEIRAAIEIALGQCRGRVSGPNGAARILGVPASTLESRIRSLGIDKHAFRRIHS
jgi:formate hydrogenlyase transcriptional activator